jgi:Lsr2
LPVSAGADAKEGAMAKQIQVVITDDIDGGEAHETIAFGLDGSSLEIDLNKLNAAQFRKTVAPYIEHGRRVSRGRGRAARPARDRGHSSDVREWAKQQGIKVSERGRIPASVVADYEAAH